MDTFDGVVAGTRRILWTLHFMMPGVIIVIIFEAIEHNTVRNGESLQEPVFSIEDALSSAMVVIFLSISISYIAMAIMQDDHMFATYIFASVFGMIISERPAKKVMKTIWP